MTARCPCGKPAVLTVRRRYDWSLPHPIVGPYEHVCGDCAPDPVSCATFQAFGASEGRAA